MIIDYILDIFNVIKKTRLKVLFTSLELLNPGALAIGIGTNGRAVVFERYNKKCPRGLRVSV